MRKVLFGSLTALAVMGCGQVETPLEPFPAPAAAPVGPSPAHLLIGSFSTKITPVGDGRSAEWVTIAQDNVFGSNPIQTVELYSSQNLAGNSARDHGCTDSDDLWAPVVVKSYFQEQLRDVAVEITNISNSAHNHCNGLRSAYGMGNSIYYTYGVLDSFVSRGTPQWDSKEWAFKWVEATDFSINYRVWAVLWPAVGTIASPLAGASVRVPYVWVKQNQGGVSLISRLYTDPELKNPVPDSEFVPDTGDSTGWDVWPNGSTWEQPITILSDSTIYYVGVFSQGEDNGVPSSTITTSQAAIDYFKYIAIVLPVFPTGSGTSGKLFQTLHGGSNELLKWTASATSDRSTYSIYACSDNACSARGNVLAGYNEVVVDGLKVNLASGPINTGLTTTKFYRWQVTQWFGAEPQTNPDQIFKFLSTAHPGTTDPDPTWP
jgi:hypothetical protein